MGILLLFCFLSMAFVGTGAFHSEEVVGLIACLELEHGWLASWPFVLTFTSTSMVSSGNNLACEASMQKVAPWHKNAGHLENLTVSALGSFLFALSYIVSCVLCFVQSLVCFVLYSFLCAGGQSEPCNSLFKHYMEEKCFCLHHTPNFDFVSEVCDNSL